MKIVFKDINISGALIIPKELVDLHMSYVNGEFLKIYLYLLANFDKDINYEMIADKLNLMEGDVKRGIAYWENVGLISISEELASTAMENTFARLHPKQGDVQQAYEQKKEDGYIFSGTQVEVYEPDTYEEKVSEEVVERVRTEELRILPDREDVDIVSLEDNEEFHALLFSAGQYLAKALTPTDADILAYIYEGLSFSEDMIEYLIELSASRGKSSLRYMEAIAIDWYNRGIKTLEEAKADSAEFLKENQDVKIVKRALGLGNRKLIDEELGYIRKWFGEYAFHRDIVEEACKRTIMNISTPSFRYVDSILTSWSEKGVKHLTDLDTLDALHEKSTVRTKGENKVAPKAKTNFDQRNDNIDQKAWEKSKTLFSS